MAHWSRIAVSILGILWMTSVTIRAADNTFSEDIAFLREHVAAVVLGDEEGPQIAIVPAYQGRVMTSTTGGRLQPSFGWINYEHVASGETTPHINVYGGEERFWLGPEGGQFSIFFVPGAKFELADWQTPPVIDTEPFAIVSQDKSSIRFRHEATLKNYSNAEFKFQVDRQIKLLAKAEAEQSLNQSLGNLRIVGYRSTNRLTNIGEAAWNHDTGLLSIWMLGMYKPSPKTTVVVPFQTGAEEELGPIVNDAYFGKPPAERLAIGDGVLYFSGDGQFRSKIGLSPRRAKDVAGSWDAEAGVLTIVKYSKPPAEATEYVNSMWELQDDPYAGDVVNSYNDGPPSPGAQPLGPFYELETSSPALALKPGESAEHVQETYHLEGDRAALDALSQSLFGVSLDEIKLALP